MEGGNNSAGGWLPLLLTLPSIGVVAVWAYTVANEWFVYTRESLPVYSLAMCAGGPASLVGLMASAVGLRACRPADRRWWWACVAANGAGLAANCAGFVVYMAPGC